MEKFAKRLQDIINEQDFCFDPAEMRDVEKALRRLAKYEKTGLEPEEIMCLCELDIELAYWKAEAENWKILCKDADRNREELMNKEVTLINKNIKLEAALARAEAERDAALINLKQADIDCNFCKYADDIPDCSLICDTCKNKNCRCLGCRDFSEWTWIGIHGISTNFR